MRHFKTVLSVCLGISMLSFFSGCMTINPVEKHYIPINVIPGDVEAVFKPSAETPRIITSRDFNADTGRMLRDGFRLVGLSSFTWSNAPTEAQLMKKAAEVGADIILYHSKYSHTETGVRTELGVIPGSSATTTTTGGISAYGSGSSYASAYGSHGGYAHARGSYSSSAHGSYSETSTTVSEPQYYTYQVPYSERMHSYSVLFYRRVKPPVLGIFSAMLNEEMRLSLGRNTGAMVNIVVNNSPAFLANVMPGDVIIQLGQHQVNSPHDLREALPFIAGTEVDLAFIRNGEERTVSVKLNPKPSRPEPEDETSNPIN